MNHVRQEAVLGLAQNFMECRILLSGADLKGEHMDSLGEYGRRHIENHEMIFKLTKESIID